MRDALASSEARYRALYENNPTMFFTLATDGTVLSVNRFGASELGYEPSELVGRPVLDVFHPEDKAAVAAGLQAHLARLDPQGISRWEFRKVRKDGETIWVREAVTTMREDDGRTVVLVVCDNITPWKRAEQELAAAKERLALTERMAALGTLVSGVAHEIRTPLTIIQSNAYLITARARSLAEAGTPTAEALLPLADEVCGAVERVDRLVGELRRFTRAGHGVHRSRLFIETPVQEAVRLFQHAQGTLVRVEADLQATRLVDADPVQVQQIVINLLQNAVEATLARGPPDAVVRITTLPGETPEEAAVLRVEDEGAGIPVEARSRMFDPLFTTKTSGSGLGLAIVDRIVKEHHARIRWATGPGGTRFEVAFPPA